MTELENQILRFLSQNPSQAWNSRDISKRLRVEAAERKEFRKLLKKMASEGKIVNIRGNRYAVRREKNTVTGTLKVHRDGYGFVIPDKAGEQDIFIPPKYLNFAFGSDKVLAAFIEKKGDKRREGRILQVLSRGKTHWIGDLQKKGRAYYVVAPDLPMGTEIVVPHDNLKGARLGQTVVVQITHYPAHGMPMRGEIAEVIGETGTEESAIASILVRHEIPRSFPRAVLEEATRLPEEISEEDLAYRVDLRDKPILTIDGIKARDFDDAVCVERHGSGFHLYVSIADVAHYVRLGSRIDQEAACRGTSVYFPDFAIPMLPERLSNDLCSLKPGLSRLTLTCEMRFDSTGEMKEAFYYESVINSKKRGVYDDIQSFFDGKSYAEETDSADLKKSLWEMKKLSEILMGVRAKRGSLDFDLPEAEILYDHAGKMTAITVAKRFFSHRLIEEFMVGANIAVASLMAGYQVPALYRVHDSPDPQKLESFLDFVKSVGVKLPGSVFRTPRDFARLLAVVAGHPMESLMHQLLLRSMRLAIYDADNRGHFGLNLKNYSHFTSPIRRYPDLVVHRQLKALLRSVKPGPDGARKIHYLLTSRKQQIEGAPGQKFPAVGVPKGIYDLRDVLHLGQACSKREREATEAEREMVDYKRCLFMQDHLRDKFFGTVRRITKFGMFVELEPHYVEGLLRVSELTDDYYVFDEKRFRFVARRQKNKTYKIGDKIWVIVKDVSLENRMVLLALPDAERHTPPRLRRR
ncbi:MAG: ribonuclease R [Deltaproteobacteria bacterium]|nr:ribonuclease R [Deltaproteobacteria bacterium]